MLSTGLSGLNADQVAITLPSNIATDHTGGVATISQANSAIVGDVG